MALAGGHRARERRDQPAAVDLVGNVFISALTAVASVPMLLLVAAAIAIGLVINVLQDSAQAALTLSTDVLLTAAACREAITAAAPAHPATFAARS